MHKFLLNKRFQVFSSILVTSLSNYTLNIIQSHTSKNLESFADFSTSFLIYITILACNRAIFAEGIRFNNRPGVQTKPMMNCLVENSIVLLPISVILVIFGNPQVKILGVFLIPLIIHDNIRYMLINKNKSFFVVVIDLIWTTLFFVTLLYLHLTNKLTSVNIFFAWVFPTLLTTSYFGTKLTFGFEKSNFLKFPWIRANFTTVKSSVFEYFFGSGLAQILILLTVIYGHSINSSSLRISQLLLFPLILLLTVENLVKNDESKFKISPKVLLERDFNLKAVFIFSLLIVLLVLWTAPQLIRVLVPDQSGFNYDILFTYAFYIFLNSFLVPYYNIFKNTNNYQIIQISRKYYLISLGIFGVLSNDLPQLDRLVTILSISTIPMLLKLEKERRRLVE